MENALQATKRYPRCIMGTCCIPWTDAYQLDERLFRQSIKHTAEVGTRHLYLFGTAGEGHAVSDRQFQQITRAFADEMGAIGQSPMVGLINTSLATVLDRIEWAAGIGVTQFQVSLPSWATCTEAETFTFFEQVCGRFPGLSFMHYNLKRSGRLLQPVEYARLAEAFANLVAVKMAGASGDDALAVQRAAPGLRLFLTEKAFAEGCERGVEAGFLISYASMNWQLARAYFQAGVARDLEAIARHRAEQAGVLAIMRDATTDSGAHIDGAFDLLFVKRYLPDFPLRLLPPYTAVSDAAFVRFVDGVREKFPHWLNDGSADDLQVADTRAAVTSH